MTKHHIPTVTDEMLEKTLDAAASPVVVLFAGGDDPDRSAKLRHRLESAAEEYDDRLIFVRIDVTENPSALKKWVLKANPPQIEIFRRGVRVDGLTGSSTRADIEAALVKLTDKDA